MMFNVTVTLFCNTRTLKINFLSAGSVHNLELAFSSQSIFINSVE